MLLRKYSDYNGRYYTHHVADVKSIKEKNNVGPRGEGEMTRALKVLTSMYSGSCSLNRVASSALFSLYLSPSLAE